MNEIEWMTNTFSGKSIVVFDVGAADFSDSILFKRRFPDCKVYAFEPNPYNLNDVTLNKAKENGINVFDVAVSDENGECKFYDCNFKLAGSIIEPNVISGTNKSIIRKYRNLRFDLVGFPVKTTRIDTFCEKQNIQKIDHMHIDVQGAEHKVMASLGEYKPFSIYAETYEYTTYKTGMTRDSFDELMFKNGYKVIKRFKCDTLYSL